MTDAPAPARVLLPPPAPKKSKKGLWITLAVVFLLPLGVCAPFCIAGAGMDKGVADGTILELDLEAPLSDGAGGGAALLSAEQPTLRDVVAALKRAAKDDKIKGLYARVGGGDPYGFGTVEELRAAVALFRASGKPAYAFAETIGELQPGTRGYALASAFDQVWLQPSGDVQLVALSTETPFFGGAFEKAGALPQIAQRKEYKNAADSYQKTTFTDAHRESMTSLVKSLTDNLTTAIAASRPALGSASAVASLMLEGPFDSTLALERKLVDNVGYRGDALAALAEKAGVTVDPQKGVKLLYVHRYGARAQPLPGTASAKVALIVAQGGISRGESSVDPLGGGGGVGSDTLARAIRQATNDNDVRGIVLRVDSPGGSYVASDIVWNEIEQAKKRGKKIVVTMGDYAASGGYFIAMNADRIVAQPSTLTGSIGVFGGKVVTAGAWEKLGVNFETLAQEGADPTLFSTDAPYSAAAQQKLDAMLDRIYRDFVDKAARGRGKSFDEMEALAHGRVWTGAQAKERGLVDELGGYAEAYAAMKGLLGLPEGALLEVEELPRRKEPFEEIMALVQGGGDSSNDEAAAAVRVGGARSVRAVARALQSVEARLDGAVLRAPLPQFAPGAP